MKKIMSLVLALALVLSMGVTVFAAESTNPTTVTGEDIDNYKGNIEVTAGYTAAKYDTGATVYNVVVEWRHDGSITYTGNQYYYNWTVNGDDIGYVKDAEKSKDAHWTVSDDAAVAITVTNKSNAAIKATCGAPAVTGNVTKVTGQYDSASNGTLTLKSAAPEASELPDKTAGTAQKGTATYSIKDVEGSISGENAVIATISVTIAKDTTATNPEG